MSAIVKAFSRAFSATDEEADSALPFLMFTVIGLLMMIGLVIAYEAPPLVAFEYF
jgi:hypothetical protein